MVSKRTSVGVIGVVSTCVACGGAVGGTDTGSGGEEGTAKENAVCVARDDEVTAEHAAWQGTDNAFGELGGTRWRGVFGEPGNPLAPLELELTLESATEGRLQVGPPSGEPEKDKGMLAVPPEGTLAEPLYYGANYELRGASFDGTELTVLLPLSSPFEDWCALQTSHPGSPSEPYYCEYYMTPNEAFVIDADDTCHLEPSMKVVDCAWGHQADHCACTTSTCVANVDFPVLREWETYEDYAERGVALRLTYDADQKTLRGVGVWEDWELKDYYVELTEVLE